MSLGKHFNWSISKIFPRNIPLALSPNSWRRSCNTVLWENLRSMLWYYSSLVDWCSIAAKKTRSIDRRRRWWGFQSINGGGCCHLRAIWAWEWNDCICEFAKKPLSLFFLFFLFPTKHPQNMSIDFFARINSGFWGTKITKCSARLPLAPVGFKWALRLTCQMIMITNLGMRRIR